MTEAGARTDMKEGTGTIERHRPIRTLQVLPSLSMESGIARFIVAYRNHIDPERVHMDFMVHRLWSHDLSGEMKSSGSAVFKASDLKAQNIARLRRELSDFYKRNDVSYDIVHCHIPNAAFLHLKAAKQAGVDVRVLHSHLAGSSDRALRRVRNVPLIAMGKRYATHAVACSQAAGRYLFGQGPFVVLRNGIEPEQFAFDGKVRARVRRELGLAGDALVIGCVGRLSKQKNFALAIDAATALRKQGQDVRLVIVGDGPLRQTLERRASQLGVADTVRFLGVRDDVAALYSAFDALVMPSIVEGLPVVAIEAQAAGLPCVLSADITREAALSETCTFLARSAGTQAWADALKVVLRARRIEGAVENMRRNGYSIADAANDLVTYYENALGR